MIYSVDNDQSKHGMIYNDKPIKKAESILANKLDVIIVIVASSYYDEIYFQLKKMGLEKV